MQGAQRVEDNHALEYAVQRANEHGLPPLVLFCLTDGYPEANRRHYRFMLEGLQDVAAGLSARGIEFLCLSGDPVELVVELAHRAAMVVTERAYLQVPKSWREQVAARISCSLLSVDTNLIVPVHIASRKREYAARTLRPRLREHFAQYCRPVPRHEPQQAPAAVKLARGLEPVDLRHIDTVLDRLRIDRTPSEVTPYFRGGEQEAERRLRIFLNRTFFSYAGFRNEPRKQAVSAMSPYLHFGHVSPLRLALEVLQVTRTDASAPRQLTLEDAIGGERGPDDGLRENKRAFLEELCVRRELAHNYVEYEPHYDRYSALPEWTRQTLTSHAGDVRPAIYDLQTLEAAATDDDYWNAAMTEMVKTGFMHNYMRMYWGKRILTWTTDPEQAYEIILALNNKYFLDGRDPNSYANVGWIFGLHDRPWPERAVFGTVRTMSAAGLERKCDISGYVRWVDQL
ncbi:MAG: deoxyribodipyrimidine photolyase [Spirochaetaceae bacterium]|nr:MAG: deoxyribodipyrimidine photolyase [Spirochaetaceae bacterium]